MLQFANANVLGVIGNIKRLTNKGTAVSVYVNYVDNFGNSTGNSLLHITLFNEAEKVFLRSNPILGDQLIIYNGTLNTRKMKDEFTRFEYYSTGIVCNYGSQILVVNKENHLALSSRAQQRIDNTPPIDTNSHFQNNWQNQ